MSKPDYVTPEYHEKLHEQLRQLMSRNPAMSEKYVLSKIKEQLDGVLPQLRQLEGVMSQMAKLGEFEFIEPKGDPGCSQMKT